MGLTMPMRQVPLECDINIDANGCSWFATSTQKGPFTAMLLSCSRGPYLIDVIHWYPDVVAWENNVHRNVIVRSTSTCEVRRTFVAGCLEEEDKIIKLRLREIPLSPVPILSFRAFSTYEWRRRWRDDIFISGRSYPFNSSFLSLHHTLSPT